MKQMKLGFKMKQFFLGFKEGMNTFGHLIGKVVNTILLSVVYLLGVGFTTLFAKITKKHFLDLKTERTEKKDTHWQDLHLEKKKLDEYYRQF